MIERIIENWLIKASEKSYQIPFSYLLMKQGYTIIHVTRHCAMEYGKDIIAINKEGTPCAFQLKGVDGGKLKLKEWQQIIGQMQQLAFTPLSHP